MGEWLTLANAAQHRGLSKKTIRRMVDDSRLQSRMTHGHWEVYIEDVAHPPTSSTKPVLAQPGTANKLLEVFEDLLLLKDHCLEHSTIWRLFDVSGLLPNNLSLLHWAQVFDRITVCERTMFGLCRTMNLQFAVIQTVYEELVQIQNLWRKYFLQLSRHGAVKRPTKKDSSLKAKKSRSGRDFRFRPKRNCSLSMRQSMAIKSSTPMKMPRPPNTRGEPIFKTW